MDTGLVSSSAPHSSSRGRLRLIVYKGATFVFATSKWLVVAVSLCVRTYIVTQYAFLNASQMPCRLCILRHNLPIVGFVSVRYHSDYKSSM